MNLDKNIDFKIYFLPFRKPYSKLNRQGTMAITVKKITNKNRKSKIHHER